MATQRLTFGNRQMTKIAMNGGGSCKDRKQTTELVRKTKTGAVLFGSITWHPREGNKGTVYYYDKRHCGSLNSIGLKNPGATYWMNELPQIVDLVHQHGVPFILSIAGFTPDEYVMIAELAFQADADGIEVNFGCPNAIDNGQRHRIAGFDQQLVRTIMTGIWRRLGRNDTLSVGMKMPPYSDPLQLVDMATMIRREQLADFITTMNTFPNALAIHRNGSYVLTIPDGYGGYAGPAVMPIALGQVQQWRKALGDDIPIIGAGGIQIADDVTAFLDAGANAVQASTLLRENGLTAIQRLV